MGILKKMGIAKRDFKERTTDRVARRGKRKGLSKAEIKAETKKRIDAKSERRDDLKEVGKGIGKVILPVASVATTILPGGNFISAGLNKIPLVNKVPVVKELGALGESFIKEELAKLLRE